MYFSVWSLQQGVKRLGKKSDISVCKIITTPSNTKRRKTKGSSGPEATSGSQTPSKRDLRVCKNITKTCTNLRGERRGVKRSAISRRSSAPTLMYTPQQALLSCQTKSCPFWSLVARVRSSAPLHHTDPTLIFTSHVLPVSNECAGSISGGICISSQRCEIFIRHKWHDIQRALPLNRTPHLPPYTSSALFQTYHKLILPFLLSTTFFAHNLNTDHGVQKSLLYISSHFS